MLEVSNMTSGYASMQVLWDINLSVKENEIHIVLGANGAGKSTFLKVVMGLLPQWSGELAMGGRNIAQLAVSDRVRSGIGYMSEQGIFPSLTVEENLKLGLLRATSKTVTSQIDSIYSRFPELKERRKSLAGGLSGGQRKLVGIGRALISEPKILLMDEPSSGLSPRYVSEVIENLSELRGGITLVIAEQNISFLTIADSVTVIEGGRTSFSGTMGDFTDNDSLKEAFFGIV